MQPFHRLVPGILEQIPVLIYAGDADFICNWLGNQAWTEALEWPGQKDFNKASIKDIKLDNGDKYGKIKNSGNFTFLQIFGAGHMYVQLPGHACPPNPDLFRVIVLTERFRVPMDQPEASLDFLNRWIGGEWF